MLLHEAVHYVEDGEWDRAAWRLADVGGMVRAAIEARWPDRRPLVGVDEPTAQGYVLPTAE